MKVTEPVYDISKCDQKMVHIDKLKNICAGGTTKGGMGTCKGDSGGPPPMPKQRWKMVSNRRCFMGSALR